METPVKISIEILAHKATTAALAVIDRAFDNATARAEGPCGDALAYSIDELIKRALIEFSKTSRMPGHITLIP